MKIKKTIFPIFFILSLLSQNLLYADDDSSSDTTNSSESSENNSQNLGSDWSFDDYTLEDLNNGNVPPEVYEAWIRNSNSIEDYYSAYSKVCAFYNTALASCHDPTTALETLEKNMNTAKAALDSFMESHGLTIDCHSDVTGYTRIVDEKGQPVFITGDPVVVSSGTYTFSDSDISLNVGKSSFKVTREYLSNFYPSFGGGSFGDLWSSNLDSRIVRCYSQEMIDEYETYKEELATVQEALAEVQKIVAEYEESLNGENEDDNDSENENDDDNSESEDENYLKPYNFTRSFSNYNFLDKETEDFDEEEKSDLEEDEESNTEEDELEKCYGIIRDLEALCTQYTSLVSICEESISNKERNLYSEYGNGSEFAEKLGNDIFIYFSNDGTPIYFMRDENGKLEPSKKSLIGKLSFEENSSGYTIIDEEDILEFDYYGIPSSITKKDGSVVSFISENGKISNITLKSISGGERSLSIIRNGNKITKIENIGIGNLKNEIFYGYENNKLSFVTDEENDTRRFSYDGNLLTKLIKADESFISINYSDFNGTKKVVSTIDENGAKENFIYHSSNAEYVDKDGEKSEFSYDKNGNTIKQIFPNGESYSFTYNENLLLKNSTGNSSSKNYEYDENGNVSKITYSDGGEENFVYEKNKLISKIDKDGIIKTFEYDEFGNLCGYSVGGKKTATLQYENGNLISTTDIFGNKKRYEYNEFGEMIKKYVFKKGNSIASSIEKFSYDELGRISNYTDSNGISFSYEYSPHIMKITSSDGMEWLSKYSSRKNLVSESVCDKKTGETRIFIYEYDKTNRLIAKYISGIDSNKNNISKTLLETYLYTNEGKLSKKIIWNALCSEQNQAGLSYEYSFKNGEISKIQLGFADSNGSMIYENAISNEFSYTLSNSGKTIIEKNSDNIFTFSNYDAFSNLISESENDNAFFQAEYSLAGRILKAKTTGNGMFEFAYENETGRFIGIREIGGIKSTFNTIEYFDNGKKSSITDRLGNKTEYSYDEFGNISKIKSSRGSIELIYDSSRRLVSRNIFSNKGELAFNQKFVYSENGKKVQFYENDELKQTCLYNSFGELISRKDANGSETTFKYDILGRRIVSTNPYGNSTFYEYNAQNQIVKITNPDNSFRKYKYDVAGNCILIQDNVGDIFRAEYDCSGRIISKDERPFSVPEKYEYDFENRLICVKKNNVVLEKYEYSSDRKTVIRIDSKGNKIIYNTDGFGRVLSQKNRLGFSSFNSYDAEGNLVKYTDFENHTTTFENALNGNYRKITNFEGSISYCEYDALGRITLAKNKNNELQYSYNSNGQLSSICDVEAGVRINYSYDKIGNLIKIKSFGGIEREISYEYDKIGSITKITDFLRNENSTKTEISFVYDKMNREILRKYKSGETIKSVYNEAGYRILQTGYDSLQNVVFIEGSIFDSNGHLALSLDTDLNVTRYNYDENGRLSSVSYPYSQSIKNHFEELMNEAGIHYMQNDFESSRIAISASEYNKLQNICSLISNGTLNVNANETVLTEYFEYDEEGNITKRKTPFGTIKYKYDEDNRLISFGNESAFSKIKLSYDKNGNLIQKVTANSSSRFEYNAENRMIRSIVCDSNGNQSDISYKYDYFGRRIFQNGSQTVYDGFGLKVLYTTAEKNANSSLSKLRTRSKAENLSNDSGRYVFIDDSINESSSSTKTVQIAESSAPIYNNSATPIAFSSLGSDLSSANRKVVMSDAQGTVKSQINENGVLSTCKYDVFGVPVTSTENFTYNFIGKRYNSIAKLYDFGYRDYVSSISRFTTVDPILDGRNWYAYCVGNPIDFVDWNGYKATHNNQKSVYDEKTGKSKLVDTEYDMHDDAHRNSHIGLDVKAPTIGSFSVKTNSGGNENYYGAGCAIVAVAEALSDLFGVDITPGMVNKPEFFDKDNNIQLSKVGEAFGAVFYDGGTKNNPSKTESFINGKINDKDNEYSIILGTHIDGLHFVTVKDAVETNALTGEKSVLITATSRYDHGTGHGRTNWTEDNGLKADLKSNDYAYAFGHGGCKN